VSIEERQKGRAFRIVQIADKIRRHIGRSDVLQVNQTVLACIAEQRALWQLLLDRGFVTEEQRQDYLDRGVTSLEEHVHAKSARVTVSVNDH